MRRFNYLSIFAVLGFLGVLGLIDSGLDSTIVSSFAYFAYLGYWFIRPDELFNSYVLKSITLTFSVGFMIMVGIVIVYYVSQGSMALIELGFWLTYTTFHGVFNASMIYFLLREGFSHDDA